MPDITFWIFVSVFFLLQTVCLRVVVVHFPSYVEQWNREVRLDRNSLLDSSDLTKLLDRFLLSDPWYDFLRRLSIIAPLAGVVVTAAQFGRLQTSSGTATGMDLGDLAVISKLYGGVAAGACVAGLNQLALFFVQVRWRAYRMLTDLQAGSTNINSTAARFSTGLQNLLAETQDKCSRMLEEMHSRVSENTRHSSELLQSAASIQLGISTELPARFKQRLDEAILKTSEEAVRAMAPIQSSIADHGQLLSKVMVETARLHTDLASVLELSRQRGETLSTLVERLSGTVEQMQNSFSGVLTTEIPAVRGQLSDFSTEVRELGSSVKRSVDELNSSSTQLSLFMDAIGGAGREITAASVSLRDSATFFDTECRDAAASLQPLHAEMKSSIQASLDAMGAMLELNSQVSGALGQASTSTSVLRDVTARMGEVAQSLGQSVELLSESGLPQAVHLMEGFGEGVQALREQVSTATDSVMQASTRLNVFYEKLRISGDAWQSFVQDEREMLRLSVSEMLKFNNEFPRFLEQVIEGGNSIKDANLKLQEVSNELSTCFHAFLKTGVPEAQQLFQGFSSGVADFAGHIREGAQSMTDQKAAFSAFLSSVSTSGETLSTVATQVRESTSSFGRSVSDAGKSLQTAVNRLDTAIEQDLVSRLRALHSQLEQELQHTKAISVQISPAMLQLSQAASAASGTLQGMGAISSEVSDSVQSMAKTLGELKKSLDDQRTVLARWGSIVESVPKSLKAQTDGVVQDMVTEVAQMITTLREQIQRTHMSN